MADHYFLCYRSETTREWDSSQLFNDLGDILKTARGKNMASDITGALLYSHGYFCQILEGPKEEVLALYNKIKTDPRHAEVTVLSAGWRQHRSFRSWAMAFAGNVDPVPQEIEGILGSAEDLDVTDAGEIMREFLMRNLKVSTAAS